MIELAFKGYRTFDAAPDDPLRVKWNAMRTSLAVETPISSGLSATLSSVGLFNSGINGMMFDATEAESLEAWQTPAQMLERKRGDCKDFALLKYALLLKANLSVRIVIGEIGSSYKINPKHAWCAVYLDGAWRTLDNMFNQIIKVEDYLNWIPSAALHDASVTKFGAQFTINDIIKGG